tara:strand:- start:2899 stop:3618 length:720 start_codon:yes stop_codon:yes gene_type:complete
MEKTKNIKFLVGLFYIILVSIFLYLLFSKYSFQDITTYKFIHLHTKALAEIRESNIFFMSIVFMAFTVIWVFALGFGSPIVIFAGYIFGKWLGAILATISMTIGAVLLYIFANFFFKELVKKKFLNRFKFLEKKFKENEFIYILIYRIIGGIPFQIQNILPVLFNVKLKNYFFGSLVGLLPQVFIIASLGSGLENVVANNDSAPSILKIFLSKEIYLPIFGFILLLSITLILKKFFYKK